MTIVERRAPVPIVVAVGLAIALLAVMWGVHRQSSAQPPSTKSSHSGAVNLQVGAVRARPIHTRVIHCVADLGNCEPPFKAFTFKPTSEYLLWRDPGYLNANYLWAGSDGLRGDRGAVRLYRFRHGLDVSNGRIFDFPRRVGALTIVRAHRYTVWLDYPGGRATFNISTHQFQPQ